MKYKKDDVVFIKSTKTVGIISEVDTNTLNYFPYKVRISSDDNNEVIEFKEYQLKLYSEVLKEDFNIKLKTFSDDIKKYLNQLSALKVFDNDAIELLEIRKNIKLLLKKKHDLK